MCLCSILNIKHKVSKQELHELLLRASGGGVDSISPELSWSFAKMCPLWLARQTASNPSCPRNKAGQELWWRA